MPVNLVVHYAADPMTATGTSGQCGISTLGGPHWPAHKVLNYRRWQRPRQQPKHAFQSMFKAATRLAATATLAVSLCACAGSSGPISVATASAGDSWTEEALLHDGQKLLVQRWVQRGGRHEVGQAGAFVEQTLRFEMPQGGRTVTWKDSFSPDLGTANFLPLLVDAVGSTAYVVAYPMGCLAYNKWGRPNPPYVVFKQEADAWKQIALQDLPLEITTPNLILSDPDMFARKVGTRVVSAEVIGQEVRERKDAQYRRVLRKPLPLGKCPQYSASPKAPG